MLEGHALAVSESYTYLGVEFGVLGAGRWRALLDRMRRTCAFRARDLLWSTGNRYGLPTALQLSVWRAVCRPLLEYGCPLWSPDVSDDQCVQLEALQLQFARSALGLPMTTSGVFVRGELGLLPLAAHRDELTLRFFGHALVDIEHARAHPDAPSRLVTRVLAARLAQAHDGTAAMSWCTRERPVLARSRVAARSDGLHARRLEGAVQAPGAGS